MRRNTQRTPSTYTLSAMRLGLAFAAAVAMLPVVGSARQHADVAGRAATDQTPVTFTKDIAPILQKHCQNCHHPNSIAPMSLMTYEEARPYARAMKTKTALRSKPGTMPPWFVEKNIGIQKFKEDPSLNDEEIRKIAVWADSGAPMGNPADVPAALKFDDAKWSIGQPDLIVTTPPVHMKAINADWWGPIGEVQTGLKEDRYIAAVEYKEVSESQGQAERQTVGARFIVHHLCWGAAGPNEDRPEAVEQFPCHEVGRNADVFDPEAPRLLKAGSKLVLNSTHLHSNGKETTSHIDIGFKFMPKDFHPAHNYKRMGLFGNSMNLDLEGSTANQKFEAFTVLEAPAKIITFEPHMHAAGIRMCLDAIWGAGVSFDTLSCVGYDHSWVRVYAYADDAQPLLPKGTILRITGHFDTTPANRNVADPRNWQGLGHRSIDNMMNNLGEIIYLTEDEFQQEMAKRREQLHLRPGQTVLGCPLCGYVKPTVTGNAPAGRER